MSFVYFIRIGDDGPIKIGVATSPLRRRQMLQTGCPTEIHILAVCEGGREVEQAVHQRFLDDRIRGEWFRASEPLLEHIASLPAMALPGQRRSDAQTLTEFATKAGISISYASQLLSKTRTPSQRLAIDIFKRTGRRFGAIAGASDDEIAVLDRLTPRRSTQAAA